MSLQPVKSNRGKRGRSKCQRAVINKLEPVLVLWFDYGPATDRIIRAPWIATNGIAGGKGRPRWGVEFMVFIW
jgi:hypothetical protein